MQRKKYLNQLLSFVDFVVHVVSFIINAFTKYTHFPHIMCEHGTLSPDGPA